VLVFHFSLLPRLFSNYELEIEFIILAQDQHFSLVFWIVLVLVHVDIVLVPFLFLVNVYLYSSYS